MTSFMDKAKELADQTQRVIQQGIEQGQEKVEELRKRRQLDDLARDLGWHVYRSRQTGGTDDEEVARLSAKMAALESELKGTGTPGGTSTGTADPEPPAGGYTLDDV